MILLMPSIGSSQNIQLIWSDEFDGSALSPDNWKYDIGDGCPSLCGWGNQELQYYTNQSDNIYVEDGMLNIVAKKENLGTKNYSSARIKTAGLQYFKYGRIEARMKLPIGNGYWPAFWMMPEENVYGGWPKSGEIDIMENRGNEPAVAEGTIHYWRRGCSGNTNTCRQFQNNSYTLSSGDFNSDFHVFAIDWDETGIKWLVNDDEYAFIPREEVDAEWYPFDESFYIIINLAIGGNFLPPPDETTVFPQTMQIDYVRVYGDVNVPPQIDIPVSEEDLNVEPGSQLEIDPQIDDTDGTIEEVRYFFVDDWIETRTEPPYAITLDFPVESCYPFQVEATDNYNGVTTTEMINFVAGNGCIERPYNDTDFVLPGTIPLWQYNYGGPGVAYYDVTESTNQGASDFPGEVIREFEAVDLMPTGEGENLPDYAIYQAETSEWTKYNVSLGATGSFDLKLRLRALSTTSVDFYINNYRFTSMNDIQPSSEIITQTLQDILLPKGEYALRVQIKSGNAELYDLGILDESNTSILPEQDIPVTAELLPPYPNPFNPEANITFRLSEMGNVRLELFDLSGRMVQSVFQGRVSAGKWSYSLSGEGLGSGVYMIRLTHPGGVLSRPVTLIK